MGTVRGFLQRQASPHEKTGNARHPALFTAREFLVVSIFYSGSAASLSYGNRKATFCGLR